MASPNTNRNQNLVDPDPESTLDEQSDQPGAAPAVGRPLGVIQGGGQGDGKPRGDLKSVPTRAPRRAPAAAPNPTPSVTPGTPTPRPGVDIGGVPNEPLQQPDYIPESEDEEEDGNRPDPRDFSDNQEEPGEAGEQSERGSGEEGGKESGKSEGGGSSSGGSSGMNKPGSSAEAAGGGLSGAGGAAAGAEAGAGEAAGKVAAQVALKNPYVLAAVGIALLLVFFAVAFFVVIGGLAAGNVRQSSSGGTGSTAPGSSGDLNTNVQADANKLLANKNVQIYAGGQQDLKTGQIDGRVISLLLAIAEKHKISVSSLKSGHSQTTSSGNVSDHFFGRGVDIASVDGKPCLSSSSPTKGVDVCHQLAASILQAEKSKDPQIIYTDFQSTTPRGLNCVGDAAGSVCADHRDHVHVGYPAKGGG